MTPLIPPIGLAGLFGISSARKRGLERFGPVRGRSRRSEVVTSDEQRMWKKERVKVSVTIQDLCYLTTTSAHAEPPTEKDRTEHSLALTRYRKMTEYDGDIIAPTVEKPTDRAWWKSATVYQGESERS
jgi:hypothetical protein